MAEFIYQMIKARKAYGDRVILDDVTLSFLPGAKIGVVGPNGMGKSTLLKIMAGLDTVSNGEAYLTPGFTVGILQQEPPLDDTKTVGENIKMAFGPIAEKVARFNQIGEEMANPDADFDALMEEMGKLQNDIDAANGWDLDSQLEQAMDALQCPDPDTPVSVCSGGERRRVALCKLLLEAPDLLLLDEPTNHLDAESILWLEQFLHQYKGAVIAVTHDRYFMDNVAEWICEVDRGHLYPYKGNYSTYLETKAKRMEIQGAKDAKLAKRLKSELDWVRSSPKARQAKNKARLERYDQMEQEARNNKKLDFSEIQIPAGPRLGSTVLEAEHIHKAFGDRVVYTRYVAPIPPKDAWVDYFKDWPQFLVPPDDPMYDLTDETAALAEGHQVVDRTTFGKWGQQLIDAIGGAKKITVCGVATDCCVLTTVLAAADSGVAVRVPADACAGSTPENQELALNTMRLFEPLITVTDTASILA